MSSHSVPVKVATMAVSMHRECGDCKFLKSPFGPLVAAADGFGDAVVTIMMVAIELLVAPISGFNFAESQYPRASVRRG
jgi:hypothetical protein